MIVVTRLNGPAFAVNPDLIERAESTPDTVLTLVDGTKYVVSEPLERLIVLIRDYRASVIAAARVHEAALVADAPAESLRTGAAEAAGDTVVALHRRER